VLAILCVALPGCHGSTRDTSDSTTHGNATSLIVDAGGIGRLRTGMTLPQVSALLGEELRAPYSVPDGCDQIQPGKLPQGVMLMVELDTVTRVEVETTGVRTVEGAQVGDSEQRVLELYKGRIHVEPHKYIEPEGHYLIVSPPGDTLHRIVFETDGKVVVAYRAGRRPSVEYVEGCL
jgi:hypothetical protein